MVIFFVQIKLCKFQNNLEIALKIMKKYLEIYFKKNLEKSWNFVRPEKWEPCKVTLPD